MTSTVTTSVHRYERWPGTLGSGRWTWLAIVANEVRLNFKRQEVRFFLLAASGLVVGPTIVFYIISLVEELAVVGEAGGWFGFLRGLLGVDLSEAAKISEYRELLWRLTFLVSIKVQFFFLLLVTAVIGPGLIADDLKSRALPIYFARPVRPWNYVLGKGLAMASFLAVVTLVPNILALILGTMITGGLGSWSQNFGLAWRIGLASVGVMAIGSCIILALSSLGADKRLATLGWLGLCMIPSAAQQILNANLPAEKLTGYLGTLALNRDIMILTEWLLDIRLLLKSSPLPIEKFEAAVGPEVRPECAAVVLGSLLLLSIVVCMRRVLKFSRAAANI